MSSEQAGESVLPTEQAARLVEFARCCKAAARAVSLYPGGHPAITSSLSRLEQIATTVTDRGQFRLQVFADTLRVNGARLPQPDAAVAELADLLHRHLIGGFDVNAGADVNSWRTLFLLLARAPDAVRADGGIAKLWAAAGGPSIVIREVDYTEVLREKQGVAAAIEQIVAAALDGRALEPDDSAMQMLLEIVGDPVTLQTLLKQLERATANRGIDAHTAVLLTLLRGLADYAGRTDPQRLEKEELFSELWKRVQAMLTSSSDVSFVSREYRRELGNARTKLVEIEGTSDDPPDRVAAWIASVNDTALRSLDGQLLVDLLTIEQDPLRWRDMAETAVAHADDLVRIGFFDQAWHLAEAIMSEGAHQQERQPFAAAALQRFGRGQMMKHVADHLRTADDAEYSRFARLCHAIGRSLIPPLAEVVAAVTDARSRKRLRDILIGFGAPGRESVQQLMKSPNWEVRRTAAYLLGEFGGAEGLNELLPLLTDDEPLVQREAVHGLILNGTEQAAEVLMRALPRAAGRTRDALIQEVTAMRDERAVPIFCYLLRHLDRRSFEPLYIAAIEALGAFGGPDAVEALTFALHQRDFWAPLTTRKVRAAAARALRRIGTPDALDVLRESSKHGPRGVRSAARSELARSNG